MPQSQSQAFFSNPTNPITQDMLKMQSYRGKVNFSIDNPEHTQFITNCTTRAKQQLNTLQSIDLKVGVAFTIGIVALGFSWILPLTMIAGACFAFAAYQLGQRSDVYKNYTQTIETLAGCCDWSLQTNKNAENAKHPSLNEMLAFLAGHVTQQQLRDLINDKTEDRIISEMGETSQSFLEQHIEKEQSVMYYKMYGYQQGSLLDVIQGIQFAITTAFLKLRAPSQNEQPTQTPISTMS